MPPFMACQTNAAAPMRIRAGRALTVNQHHHEGRSHRTRRELERQSPHYVAIAFDSVHGAASAMSISARVVDRLRSTFAAFALALKRCSCLYEYVLTKSVARPTIGEWSFRLRHGSGAFPGTPLPHARTATGSKDATRR